MPIDKFIRHPLVILAGLCLSIGIYKIVTMACVSNDSVAFMEFSTSLKKNAGAAIKANDQHPGYPAIILASEKILSLPGFHSTLNNRILAAQAVTLFCRAVAILFLYHICLFFGNKKEALVISIIAILVPMYANIGSDVLSDWPNLMLMAIALYFCLKGLPNNSRVCFLVAGLTSGLAYWIRPEGITFVVVMILYSFIQLIRKKAPHINLCICCGIMIISAATITAPYMLYKGALFPKKKVGTLSQMAHAESSAIERTRGNRATSQSSMHTAALSAHPARAVLHFIHTLFKTLLLFSVPLAGITLFKIMRFSRLRPHERFLVLFVGLWLVLMIWLYTHHGYMSHRHIMPLVVFSFAWLLKGLHGLCLVFGCRRKHLHRHTGILIAIGIALFFPKLIRPAHADKAIYKQAGLWLKDNTPEKATLTVFDNRIGFYAERHFDSLTKQLLSNHHYLILKEPVKPSEIPSTALPLTTDHSEMDKVIRIFQISP